LKLNVVEILAQSNIQIGIIFRKGLSGMKSVLKLYQNIGFNPLKRNSSTKKLLNLDSDNNIDATIQKLSGSNIYTSNMRIELYVNEKFWKKVNCFTREFLYTFICQVEYTIVKMLCYWNDVRFHLHYTRKENPNDFIKYYILTKKNAEKEELKSLNFQNEPNKNEFNNQFRSLDKETLLRIYEMNLNNQTSELENILNMLIDQDEVKISNTCNDNKISFDFNNSNLIANNEIIQETDKDIIANLSEISVNKVQNDPLPMYIISTRDCFVYDVYYIESFLNYNGRKITRKEFFFEKENFPSNLCKFINDREELRVGCVTYENFFTNEELKEIERNIDITDEESLKDLFLPETAQKSFAGKRIKRTKFFFGSRYMWTKRQLAEPNSYVGAGITTLLKVFY